MTIKFEKQTEFQPGRGYTRQDWDDVSDNPPWTEEELRSARPFREVFPELAAKIEEEIAARNKAEENAAKAADR